MSRSDDPTRIGDILLVALGVVLLGLAVPFGIGAVVSLGDDEGFPLPMRIGAILLLGGLSYASAAAGWHLTKHHLEELVSDDEYEGPRWPDVTVKEERRLRLAERKANRRS